MYKICVTKQAIARQRELEAGLLSAMSTKRYEDISVSDLCDSLDIPRKAFYRYFSNKEGALYALIDHTLMDALEEFLATKESLNCVETIMASFFSFWLGKKTLLDALQYNNLSGILLQRASVFVMSDESLSLQIFPADSKPTRDYVSVFLISGIISLIIQWHHNGFDKSPKQMASVATYFLPASMSSSLPLR